MALFLAFAVFGLIIGSFLNVVILRHGIATITGRSHCPHCKAPIEWYDLVPVFSWIILRGRCRHCKAPISAQYPLVEGSTAIIFGTLGYLFFQYGLFLNSSSLQIIPFLICAALLVAISVYDIHHMIIPDEWAYLFAFTALCSSLIWGSDTGLMTLLSGPIAAAPLYMLWAVSGGRWMGLGDPKLALGIGWLLGAYLGLVSVFLSFIIGALFSLGILIPLSALQSKEGQITMKSEVPFGPFLVAATFLVWFAALGGYEWTLWTL